MAGEEVQKKCRRGTPDEGQTGRPTKRGQKKRPNVDRRGGPIVDRRGVPNVEEKARTWAEES